MKRFLVTIWIASMAILLFSPSPHADQQRRPFPNIVIILADDLGYGDLSCYGATKVETPNIDRLAKEGMRFTDAHSPHSVCTPTRYALLTGRYAWRTWVKHRCVWSDDPLLIDTDRLTLPKLLKSAGYQTACIGKWHLGFGSPDSPGWNPRKGPDYNRPLKPGPLECGFDYFFGIPHVGQHPHVYVENHQIVGLDPQDPIHIVLDERNRKRESYRDRQNITPWHEFTGGEAALYKHEDLAIRLTEEAIDWIERQQHEPFFLYFAPRNVHSPLTPHPRFAGKSEIGVYGDFILELDWSVGEILDAHPRVLGRWKDVETALRRGEKNILSGAGWIAFKDHPLEYVRLAGSPFDGDGLRAVAQIKALKTLNVFHTAVTDDDMAALRGHPNLEEVVVGPMWDNKITNRTIEHVSKIPNIKRFKVVETYMSYDGGLEHLARLGDQIEAIDLGNTVLPPGDIERLKKALPNANITHDSMAEIGKLIVENWKGANSKLHKWAPAEVIDAYIAAAKGAEK